MFHASAYGHIPDPPKYPTQNAFIPKPKRKRKAFLDKACIVAISSSVVYVFPERVISANPGDITIFKNTPGTQTP